MKQTAVEWIEDEFCSLDDGIKLTRKTTKKILYLFSEAKEMEKEQIMKAVYDSMGTNLDPNMGRAELYYNETFKSE